MGEHWFLLEEDSPEDRPYPLHTSMRAGYDYDSERSIHLLRQRTTKIDESSQVDLVGLVVRYGGGLPDIVSSGILDFGSNVLCNYRFCEMMDACRMGFEYTRLKAEIWKEQSHDGRESTDYWVNHIVNSSDDVIDYPESKFYSTALLKKGSAEDVTLKEHENIHGVLSNLRGRGRTLRIARVRLIDKSYDAYYFSMMPGAWLISEAFAKRITQERLTGVRVTSANGIVA